MGMSKQHVEVVVGGQYGSEGKGAVVAHRVLANEQHGTVLNVRVGGHNAGHTAVSIHSGQKIALRTIPMGVVVSDTVEMFIAAGSEVNLDVLEHELQLLTTHGHPNVGKRLTISGEATLLEQKHIDDEHEDKMHEKLGSTAKGVGASRADRLWRKATRLSDSPEFLRIAKQYGISVLVGAQPQRDSYRSAANLMVKTTHEQALWGMYHQYDTVVVEGTQGYGLGLHAGNYPMCTSNDTRAVDFMAMAGYTDLGADVHVWVASRVYPIRVGGNSGPIANERDWSDLGLAPELTTVTKTKRRVGEWDQSLYIDSVLANGGSDSGHVHVVLTMVDQKFPVLAAYAGSLYESLSQIDDEDQVPTEVFRAFSQLGKLLSEKPFKGVVAAVTLAPDKIDYVPTTHLEDVAPATSNTYEDLAHMLGTDNTAILELAKWWTNVSAEDLKGLVGKMVEYGGVGRSVDLEHIGRELAATGIEAPKGCATEQQKSEFWQELGVYFYVVGKMGRWAAALRDGHRVSDDTIHDLVIYGRMVQRIRNAGGWIN